MRLKTKIKKAIRRNERKMTTKKAKKAIGTVAFAIFTILSIQALISVANSSKVITIDNWDARIAAESPTVLPEAQDEAKDGGSGTKEETELVEAKSPSEVVKMIEETFPEEKEIAVAIAKCESSLNPETIGDKHMAFPSVGLFQINQTWHKYSTETLKNPKENIRIAKEIHDRWGNWNAWSCYKQGLYEKYT